MSGPSQSQRPTPARAPDATDATASAGLLPDISGGMDAASALLLQGVVGNAGIAGMMKGLTDWWSGGEEASEVAPAAPDAGAPAEASAAEPSAAGAKRRVAGEGGYVYEQFADGSIVILDGPGGAGAILAPGTPANTAVTGEIGAFTPGAPAQGEASAEAPVEAATEASAADTPAAGAGEDRGWLEWMGSSARKVEEMRRQVDPGYWLAKKAGDAVSTWWGGEEEQAPREREEAAATTPGEAPVEAAAPAAPSRRRPTGTAVTRSGDAPEAAGTVEGTDTIEVNSLVAAEGYLPQYDESGKLVSGIGKYGFDQDRMIRDAEARQWEDGATSSTPVEEGSEEMKTFRGSLSEDKEVRKGEQLGMTQMWCSGLSCAVLSDLGFDLDASIPDQYYWENGKQKSITMRMVIEGMPEIMAQTEEMDTFCRGVRDDKEAALAAEYDAVAAMPEETKTEKSAKARAKAALDAQVHAAYVDALYSLDANFGDTAASDSLLVKGGAGAIELAKLGREVGDLTQVRPGDFCQWRNVDSARGHAFQVHSVIAKGAVLIGLPGSPEIVGQAPEAEPGATVQDVTFRITSKTNPNTIVSAEATEWSVIESNTAGSQKKNADPETGEEADREGDGGVAITQDHGLPETPDDTKRYYVGRLAASPWYASLGQEA